MQERPHVMCKFSLNEVFGTERAHLHIWRSSGLHCDLYKWDPYSVKRPPNYSCYLKLQVYPLKRDLKINDACALPLFS